MALTAASYKPVERVKQTKKGVHFSENDYSSNLFSGEENRAPRSKKRRESIQNSLAPPIGDRSGGASNTQIPGRKGSRRQSGADYTDRDQANRRRGSILKKVPSSEAEGIPSIKRWGSVQKNEGKNVNPDVKQKHDPKRALDLMSLKFKGQTIAEKTGKKRGDEALGFMGLPRRRSTINLYSNVEVLDVLSTIQEQQKKREQDRVKSQLDTIKRRVKRTLDDIGMEFESEDEEEGTRGLSSQPARFSTFDTRAEREKMRERTYIMGKIDEFEEKAVVKKQYLTELMCWFEENLNMCHDVITPDELKELVWNSQELHKIISDSLAAFIRNAEKTVEKGKQLLEETGKIIAERRANMAKRTKKERIIVYDDKTLLQDPIKWESAAKTIISVFEDSQKMIRNIMFKNALKLSQRQFEYINAASEKRYKDLDEKKKQCMELQGKLHTAKVQGDRIHRDMDEQRRKMDNLNCELSEKLHTAKVQGDRLHRDMDEQRRKIDKVNWELSETKLSVEKLQSRNRELNQDIAERNSKIKFLEEKLREKLKTPTPPPTPPPPPEPEKVIVKVIDSATELQLQETEEELEEVKAELKKLQDESRLVTEKLVSERELCKGLQERITELENIPTPEPIVIAAPATPVIETPPAESDRDSQYYKTLMTGMKKEYAAELEKIKAHIVKEKTRGEAGLRKQEHQHEEQLTNIKKDIMRMGEAGVRKLEHQHKEQLTNIQKDIMRMLRGILHFRDHMMSCFEKENLFDQAQALHDLGDLVKDKLSPDPKELLAVIVSTVIDYLHNMEGILFNAFRAMRILMKYQIEKQVESEVDARMAKFKQEQEVKKVQKEVQKKQKVLKGAKQDVKHLAKRLKKAKNKLKRYQKDLENVPADKRYKDLLQRYNHVIKLYKNMCKEMEMLQSDFHDTMKKKLEEKETMVITQIKMEMKQKRAITEEQLKISIRDKKENLFLLSKAYEENKISGELYKMASTMIKKAMDIPRIKLQNLFEQYITFRTVQESKERVHKVLQEEESDLLIDTRREMELYVDQMDERFNTSMVNWRVKMKQLDIENREINKRIYTLFNEVLLETGILLVHPLLKDNNKRNIMAQATGSVTRNRLKQLMFKNAKKFKTFMDMPDVIQGSSIPMQNTGPPLWTLPVRPPSEPAVDRMPAIAPHMLAYNVNGPKILAARQLRRNALLAGRRNTLLPQRTESFHINDSNVLQHLRDYSMQPFVSYLH